MTLRKLNRPRTVAAIYTVTATGITWAAARLIPGLFGFGDSAVATVAVGVLTAIAMLTPALIVICLRAEAAAQRATFQRVTAYRAARESKDVNV
ncbi:hypothetical protein ACFY05_31945 [Microtetraspora fusca]|uniref:DUF4229 domain-containing protein n=1 Tax=Microtetraspora fusca TaxID=1997 RepID=A0ABW6VER0_MICFU